MMNDLPFADLHVHSYFSDGTMSPAELIKEAKASGVGLFAVADHDTFAGSAELCNLGEISGIQCIPAAEITCTENKKQVHVLCYRPDFSNEAFMKFVAEGRHKLDMMSVRLIEKMEQSGINVSVSEFNEFEYDRSGGGWKALHYFVYKGVTSTLHEGASFYDRYGCGYDTADFPSVKTTVEKIHSANGIAVIAHPGVSIPFDDPKLFISELERFVSYGADGIECFYPEHSDEITAICEKICDDRGLLKTCGSDFHGTFGSHPFAVPKKRTDELRLCGIN